MKSFIATVAIISVLAVSAFSAADATGVNIEADKTEMIGNVAHASGSVRITHLAVKMQADRAIYDPTTKKITLDGEVRVEQAGNQIIGVHATYFLNGQIQMKGPHKTVIKTP